jgi:hypothetical protein
MSTNFNMATLPSKKVKKIVNLTGKKEFSSFTATTGRAKMHRLPWGVGGGGGGGVTTPA